MQAQWKYLMTVFGSWMTYDIKYITQITDWFSKILWYTLGLKIADLNCPNMPGLTK